LFAIFDVDRDGFVTDKDLMHIVRMMAGSSLTDEEACAVAVRTLTEHDKDGDGKISFPDFEAVC
jgi:serine/threonine-protein phosphatase 2B regulatory subunit